MSTLIVRSLKRWPRLYSPLQRAYYEGMYLAERYLLGSKLHEIRWRRRKPEDAATCSEGHPHRRFLADRLASVGRIESILEVGCSAGQNLLILAQAFPAARLYGVDINRRALAIAREIFRAREIDHATVFHGRADDLGGFGDRSVDVVFSDATLMYVGPDKIHRAVCELLRVARMRLMLNEWHLFEHERQGPAQRSRYHFAHWVHDYGGLVTGAPGVKSVRIEKLPPGLWGADGWQRFGALIEVEL